MTDDFEEAKGQIREAVELWLPICLEVIQMTGRRRCGESALPSRSNILAASESHSQFRIRRRLGYA